MLAAVQAHDLVRRVRPQAHGLLNQQEDDGDDHAGPCRGRQHAQGLHAEELESPAVEHALHRGAAGGKQAGQDRAQRAADPVHGDGADRVVDLRRLVKELDSQHDHEAANQADQGRPEGVHRVAPGRDTHQAA